MSVVPRYFFKVDALVWRLFFVAIKIIQTVSFSAVSKSCAKAFEKQKNSRSAAQEQSIERGLGMPWYRPAPG
jgi:hypothetical protein